MRGGIFGGQHGAQGKAAAVLGVVGDGDTVGLGVVADAVDARHFAQADGADGQFVGGAGSGARHGAVGCLERALHPARLAVEVLEDAFGQGDGGAARGVQLVDVVRLAHAHVVARELVHNLGQVLVDGREDGHAQAEVARPEQRPFTLGAEAAHFLAVFFRPARAARHELHARLEGLHVVAVGSLGIGELDGHVGRAEGFGLEVLLVVDVDDADDFVSAATGNAFYFLAHLAITDQCYFHCSLFSYYINVCKYSANREKYKSENIVFSFLLPRCRLFYSNIGLF